MNRFVSLPPRSAALLYIVVDGLCVGLGMGVPIFNIALGFAVGVYVALRVGAGQVCVAGVLRRLLRAGVLTALLTMAFMLIIWLPWTRVLFDGETDISQVGIPLILYDPVASFIGWQVLMILISPFLQLLTTVFAAVAMLANLQET